MAIDIKVTDGVATTIPQKLLDIANAAERAQRTVAALQKSLNSVTANKNLASIGTRAASSGNIPSASTALSGNRSTRTVESAYVTAAKELQKRRNEIAQTFERGISARERANARIVSQIERATARASARSRVTDNIRIAPVASASQTRQMQSFYNDLFGAHTLSTVPLTQNLQRAIASSTGTALQQANAATLRQRQSYYNDLFGAHNITNTQRTRPNIRSVIDQNTGAGTRQTSASQLRQQQSMYNSLFNATPAVPSPRINTTSISATSAAARQATTSITQLSGAMNRLEGSVSFLRSDGLRWAKVLWALGGATLTAGAIVDAADAYTRLQNRLSVVSKDQAQVNALTQDMLNISVASRQPIEETAKTFTRVDLAMQQLGRSQTDSMKITENVAKALKLGGATAGEAASALLQLSQAFNKGKLDGDEFRSVMENSPILADALAAKLKVTRGELLKLAPQGKITASIMADAFIGATEKIDAAFAKLRPTIAESFTVFRSRAIVFFGELDKQIGATAALSNMIMTLSKNLDTLTFIFLALAPIIGVFVGKQLLTGFAAIIAYAGRTAVAVGAVRNPIVTATVALVNMGRTAVTSGIQMSTAFTTATTRAIALQMAIVRVAAGMALLANVARTVGATMLAAFSFGNILMVIAIAVAALVAFGDQMVLNTKTGETMRDRTIAVFQELGDFVVSIFNSIYDTVVLTFGGMVDESQTTTEKVSSSIFGISLAVAVTMDACHTLISNLLGFLSSTVKFFGDTIYNTFALLQNLVLGAVNIAIDALNWLGGAANTVLSAIGSDMRFGELGRMAGRDYSTGFLDSLSSDLYGNKHGAADTLVNTVVPRIQDRSAKIAAERAKSDKLRAADAAQAAKAAKAAADADKKKNKNKGKTDEEKRADIIKKATIEEQKAIATAQLYGDAKERIAKIEDVNGKLAMKNFALLSNAEKASLEQLVDKRLITERIGKVQEDLYNKFVGVELEYAAAIEATNNMRQKGIISLEQYAGAQAKIRRDHDMATDPTFQYLEELQKAQRMQGLFGSRSAGETAVQGAINNAKENGSAVPTFDQLDVIRKYATEVYNLSQAQEAMNSVWAETYGVQEQTYNAMQATSIAYDNGALSIDMYTRKMAALVAQQSAVQEQMFGIQDPIEPFRRGLYQLAADMPTIGQGMADAIQSTLGTAIDNLSSTMTSMIMNFDAYAESVADALDKPVSTLDVLRYALSDIIKQIGTELIGAVIKLGIQWAIQAAMGQTLSASMAAATTAQQMAMATTLNAAWTPAAISASIATMGAAATTGTMAFTMAQLAGKSTSLLGFANGSDVINGAGTSRSDSILARVSTGEMVMNAPAVQNNYPMLRAMQDGAQVGGGFSDNSVHVAITIDNNGNAQFTDGNANELAKQIVNISQHEARKVMKGMMQQGQQLYRGG